MAFACTHEGGLFLPMHPAGQSVVSAVDAVLTHCTSLSRGTYVSSEPMLTGIGVAYRIEALGASKYRLLNIWYRTGFALHPPASPCFC